MGSKFDSASPFAALLLALFRFCCVNKKSQGMNERIQLWYRLENLDGISIKQKSSQLIATGMDFLLVGTIKF